MNVLFIYWKNTEETYKRYAPIFDKLNINIIPYELQEGWEDQDSFFEQLKKSNHLIFPVNKADLHQDYMMFIAGYCLGKKDSLYLIPAEKDLKIPGYLSIADLGYNSNELEVYFKKKYKMWLHGEELKKAEERLKEMNLYLTPHHFLGSIKDNNAEAVKLYLFAGYSPDLRDEKSVPALCIAARNDSMEICTLLIREKCDINAISGDNGNTALMDAVAKRNNNIIPVLIDAGTDLNIKSKNAQTALMLAVGHGDVEVVKLLLEAKAATDIKDVLGMSAMKYAAILKHEKIIALLSRYENG